MRAETEGDGKDPETLRARLALRVKKGLAGFSLSEGICALIRSPRYDTRMNGSCSKHKTAVNQSTEAMLLLP